MKRIGREQCSEWQSILWGKNRDVVGGGCMKDVNGDIVAEEDSLGGVESTL